MTRRERIIVAATVVAALYGGYQFLAPKAKKPSSGQRGVVSENLTPFAAEVVGRMRKLDAGGTDAYVVARGNSPWPSNPFFQGRIQPEEEAAAAMAVETVVDQLSFSGYLQIGDRTFAIINGTEYETGETLPGFGLTVVSIEPKRVALSEDGGSGTVVLTLAGVEE